MPCFPCFPAEEPCNGTWYLKVTSLLATGRNTCIPNKEALSFLRVRMKSNELTWVLKHPFRLNSPSVNKAHLALFSSGLALNTLKEQTCKKYHLSEPGKQVKRPIRRNWTGPEKASRGARIWTSACLFLYLKCHNYFSQVCEKLSVLLNWWTHQEKSWNGNHILEGTQGLWKEHEQGILNAVKMFPNSVIKNLIYFIIVACYFVSFVPD